VGQHGIGAGQDHVRGHGRALIDGSGRYPAPSERFEGDRALFGGAPANTGAQSELDASGQRQLRTQPYGGAPTGPAVEHRHDPTGRIRNPAQLDGQHSRIGWPRCLPGRVERRDQSARTEAASA
jgi:hypothetical protein